MPAYLSPLFNEPQSDANGSPLVGGQIFTYLAGSTTLATTYTSSAGTVAQSNPIVLNSRGVPDNPIWLGAGVAYKFVLQDVNGVTLAPTIDSVQGINDPSAVTAQDEWVPLSASATYLSATSFSVAGDQTPTLHVGRRVKTINAGGVVYSTITLTSFAVGVTTVTLSNDTGSLDSGLSAVSYALLSALHDSVPRNAGRLLAVQFFGASATYTPTAGTNSVVVEIVGGGGAGGGCATTGAGQLAAGGGGGAGAYAKARLTTGFAGVAVTVGAGGAIAVGAGGGDGGTTSFGAVFSASGGSGGTLGTVVSGGTISFAAGGSGGTASGSAVIKAKGTPGGSSIYGTNAALSGAGAASFFGGGGFSVSGTSAGAASTASGGGGSGGALLASAAAVAGGQGGTGLCVVWEYA